MSTSTIVWIIVAVIVAIIVIGIIAFLVRKARAARDHKMRTKAEELRSSAVEKEGEIRRHQATAAEVEARAKQAQAEAEQKQAQAARMAEEARERREVADARLNEHQQTLQEADRLDPDVDHEQGGTPRQGPLEEPGGSHRA